VTEALAAMCKTLAPTYTMQYGRAKLALGAVSISDEALVSMVFKATEDAFTLRASTR
jgi:hypothetical protein